MPEKYVKGQKVPTAQYPYPIYSNGTEDGALYGFTHSYKIEKDAVTISARGTIGYHEVRAGKFTPIVRLITMVADESKITTKFLHYALYVAGIEGVTTGIPSLTVPMLEKFTIPLPPLPIQQEIIRILDHFAELTAELTEKLTAELAAQKKQYEYYRHFLLTFEEPATSTLTDRRVRWVRLGDVAALKSGKGISSFNISENKTEEFGIPCIGGNGHRGFVREYSHDGNYVIVGRQGALCGNVKRVSGKFYATEHAVVVDLKTGFDSSFAFHLLTNMNLNQYATKSAQPGLAVSNIEKLEIPLPSLEEQGRIGAILDHFDALTTDLTNGLPAEITARKRQYEYYRDRLLNFEEAVS